MQWPATVPQRIVSALKRDGIERPYSHQAACWRSLEDGNAVVATPTASGKSLCYNVPVASRLAENPGSRALYLFPTKALARDQESTVRGILSNADIHGQVFVFDGDTPSGQRRKIRAEASVVITNPDMLHAGILPHHTSWGGFFSGLDLVVVDELHTYRGVFGAHVANVLRRLTRIARFYGSRPRFVCCSATISNPRELAETVVGQPFELISQSGAPRGERSCLIYNPALVDPERGLRRSSLKEAARLTRDLVGAGLTVLTFCQSRHGVELVLRYLRERIEQSGGQPQRIRGYRGGYLPTLRREIEGALHAGEVDAVVATNALELGIDVGGLDAVVLAGYPGTIASFHQRAGRAGRRLRPSLAVLVANSSPIDQFLCQNAQFLFDSSPERALVEPNNLEILLSHLRCATFELPLSANERYGDLTIEDTDQIARHLMERGDCHQKQGRTYYIGEGYPASEVSLRSVGLDKFVVVDVQTGEPLSEVDPRVARHELYPRAIYQHEAEVYLVESLDLENRVARVRTTEPTHYTRVIARSEVEIVETVCSRDQRGCVVETGDVTVTESITGFKKIRFRTHENLGHGEVEMPRETMETEATWCTVKPRLLETLEETSTESLLRALDGLAAAMHHVAALHLMCDPRDLSSLVRNDSSEKGRIEPSIFFWDAYPGGVGLASRLYEDFFVILAGTQRLVADCACQSGCPSCIGPVFADTTRHVKDLVMSLARGLRGPHTVAP